MAIDALDPGPNGDYPNLPRNPDGTLDTQRIPIKPYSIEHNGQRILIDPVATGPDGRRTDQILPLPPE